MNVSVPNHTNINNISIIQCDTQSLLLSHSVTVLYIQVMCICSHLLNYPYWIVFKRLISHRKSKSHHIISVKVITRQSNPVKYLSKDEKSTNSLNSRCEDIFKKSFKSITYISAVGPCIKAIPYWCLGLYPKWYTPIIILFLKPVSCNYQ